MPQNPPWYGLLNNLFSVPLPPKPTFDAFTGQSHYYPTFLQNPNANNGVVGQYDYILKSAKADNGGLFGAASELLFGNKTPEFPGSIAEVVLGKPGTASSISETVLGGTTGEELAKTLKSLTIPLIVVGGLIVLSRKW